MDHIYSNPPFYSDHLKSDNEAKNSAKHIETLSYRSLIFHASKYLKEGGKLTMIYPFFARHNIIEFAKKQGYLLNRTISIKPKPSKNPNRFIVELVWRPSSGPNPLEEELVLYEDYDQFQKITEEWKDITKDLYI